MAANVRFSLFTKPWPDLPLPQLGEMVADMGFDGIELPVRPGFQLTPEQVAGLPGAARTLAELGVRLFSIAGPTDQATIAACAEAGIAVGDQPPIIRTMARIPDGVPYLEAEAALRREYEALLPLLERYGVRVGIQNHCGRYVSHAMGLRRLVEGLDPRYIGIVWDAAHNALQGESADLALDIVWSHLYMVNLKNAFWRQTNGPEAEWAEWSRYWTDGRHGLASWPNVIGELKRRAYTGVLCLTAEYTEQAQVNRLIRADLAFAKELCNESTPVVESRL